MNVDEIVDSYVSNVVKRLPRRQRVDVALELKSLLGEELAADGGTGPTPERARELIRAFGRPAEVAARYRPTQTIIDQADSRLFVRASVIGVLVIWLVGALVIAQEPNAATRAGMIRQFQAEAALNALWWPGLLVVCFAVAAWVRRRWPRFAEWTPRAVDRNQVNRLRYGFGAVGAVGGAFILADPSLMLDKAFGGRAGPEAYAAFAYDAGFARTFGPAVLVVLGAHVLLLVALILRGRWEPLTRWIDVGLTIVTCTLLTWILFAVPIFQARPTDQAVRLAILVTVVTFFIAVARRMRDLRLRAALATRP